MLICTAGALTPGFDKERPAAFRLPGLRPMRKEAYGLLVLSLPGQILERAPLGFVDEFSDENVGNQPEHGVNAVREAEADTGQHDRERHGDQEVRTPLYQPAKCQCGAAEL